VPASLLTLIVFTPILAGWLGVWLPRYLATRRSRVRALQWARLAIFMSDVDADLDRTWAAEQERIRRYR
jgi:hypothetical protein